MIEAVVPWIAVKEGLRRESTGMAALPAMLWSKPNVWPISWETAYTRASCSTSSGIFLVRTRGSTCAVCTKRQLFRRRTTSLNMSTEADTISPVSGSAQEGPMALAVVLGMKRMQLYLRLSGSKEGSPEGKSRTWSTSFRPIASKAAFQARTPSRTGCFHNSGKASSIYHTMGCFTETDSPRCQASMSEGSIRQRLAKR